MQIRPWPRSNNVQWGGISPHLEMNVITVVITYQNPALCSSKILTERGVEAIAAPNVNRGSNDRCSCDFPFIKGALWRTFCGEESSERDNVGQEL